MTDSSENIDSLRQLVKTENELINHRLTWLATFQGLLLAALAFAWNKKDAWWIVVVLCLVGMAVALSTGVATYRANLAIKKVNDWWDANRPADYLGLGVEGIKSHEGRFQKLMPGKFLPWLFFAAWAVIGLIHSTRCG